MRRLWAVAAGVLLGALPALARAAEEQDRTLPAGADLWRVVLLTVLGLFALFVVAALGYLYRRERRLEWPFQQPDRVEHH